MESEKIKLLVRPNSRKNSIEGLYQDRIKIKISKPAEKGKANKELISFISEITGIPEKDIKITSGQRSSLKEISIIKSVTESLAARLLKTCRQ